MALQSQSSSPLADFGSLVRRRIWTILLPFAFVTALGVMGAQLMPKTYAVSTMVKVNETGSPGTGNTIQRDVGSAKNDLKAPPLVRSVIESQEWPEFIGLTEKEKGDYVQRVADNVLVNVPVAKTMTGSVYITISYVDSEGARAEKFLNMLRDRYLESVIQRVRDGAKSDATVLRDLRQGLYVDWQKAEQARVDLAKEYNLTGGQPQTGGGSARFEDPVYSQLVQAQNALHRDQTALTQEQTKLQFTKALFEEQADEIPEEDLPAAQAAVASGKDPKSAEDKQVSDLQLAIFDLREKQKRFRKGHSEYEKITDRILEMETKIGMLTGTGGPTTLESRPTVYRKNPRRALYAQQISDSEQVIAGLKGSILLLEGQVKDLTGLHAERQEVNRQLVELANEADRAHIAYLQADGALQDALMKVDLLSGPQASPFDVVSIAMASETPTAPNVPLFIGVAALLGLALGLGAALAAEFVRNGYRSVADLTRGLGTPVLATVNTIVTRDQGRRAWARHALVVTSSAVIVGAILWITWAYQHDSLRLLGPRLTQIIDDLRLAFRP